MRALFTTHGGSGHWRPLAPLALALRAAEHEVAFARSPAFCSIIAKYGFSCFPIDSDHDEIENSYRTIATNAPQTSPEPAAIVWADIFAGSRVRRAVPQLLAIGRSWHPDLIVREISEFAGCLAAERLGLPHVAVQISAYRPELHNVIAKPLERARKNAGLPPEPPLSMLYRYALIALAPPSFQPAGTRLPETTRFVRYTPFDQLAHEPEQDWVATLPPHPLVYATLGTAYNKTTGARIMIQEAFKDDSINLILTTGEQEQIDIRQSRPHQWISSYLPQSRVFAACDAVICHGGFNTIMTAISYSQPLVILPIAADQPENASRCQELGIGLAIDPDRQTPAAIRRALHRVLSDSRLPSRIETLRDEMRALPGPADAVNLFELMAKERSPLSSATPGAAPIP